MWFKCKESHYSDSVVLQISLFVFVIVFFFAYFFVILFHFTFLKRFGLCTHLKITGKTLFTLDYLQIKSNIDQKLKFFRLSLLKFVLAFMIN